MYNKGGKFCTFTTAGAGCLPTPCAEISSFMVFNGALYFAGSDGTNGVELWKSDGTNAGTVLVKDINPAGDSFPDLFTSFGLWFGHSFQFFQNIVQLFRFQGGVFTQWVGGCFGRVGSADRFAADDDGAGDSRIEDWILVCAGGACGDSACGPGKETDWGADGF